MGSRIELELGFASPVDLDVLHELSPRCERTPDGLSAALLFSHDAQPSMILAAVAAWLDEHGVSVTEVNLDVT